MSGFPPPLPVAGARAPAQSGVMAQSDAPISSFGVAAPQQESIVYHFRRTGKLHTTGAAFVSLAMLAFTAALVFLVLHCFRALTSGKSTESYGVTARRLAEEGGEPCSVSRCLWIHSSQHHGIWIGTEMTSYRKGHLVAHDIPWGPWLGDQ